MINLPFEFAAANPVAEAVYWACIMEIQALKPGNVSVYSEGHGMTVSDFVVSARCVANILAMPDLSVGERIFRSIAATQSVVGCNTNLGIVLLCAPLAHSMLLLDDDETLAERLNITLQNLDINDTRQVFESIRFAKPAGLGNSEQHDVHQSAQANLLQVMQSAAQQDRIAYQYSHGFCDIFDVGLPAFEKYLASWDNPAWATVGVYLNFLSQFADTHIKRKLGAAIADQVRAYGQRLLRLFEASRQPEDVMQPLLLFDRKLKQRGINPGTSADLTVASLFVNRLLLLEKRDYGILASR